MLLSGAVCAHTVTAVSGITYIASAIIYSSTPHPVAWLAEYCRKYISVMDVLQQHWVRDKVSKRAASHPWTIEHARYWVHTLSQLDDFITLCDVHALISSCVCACRQHKYTSHTAKQRVVALLWDREYSTGCLGGIFRFGLNICGCTNICKWIFAV